MTGESIGVPDLARQEAADSQASLTYGTGQVLNVLSAENGGYRFASYAVTWHDARVMVREPAKWVAKLRATQTDASTVLFRAEAGSAAHSGPSGRYDRLHYQAEILAFILEELGAA